MLEGSLEDPALWCTRAVAAHQTLWLIAHVSSVFSSPWCHHRLAFPAPPAPADGCAVVCPLCKASLGKDFSLPIHPVLLRQGFDSWKLPDLVALGLSEVELSSLSLYLLYLWTNSDV